MLIDTFMFYNELNVLELRLTLLDDYVDRFVLVESEVNHTGGLKELFFQNNRERYAKWLPKITHVIVTAEESPKDENPWSREKYQRECILRGIRDVPDGSIIMVSDVDEIPDMSIVPYEKLPHVLNSVHMWMFEYSLDYLFTGEPWFGTVITTAELFKRVGPNALRDGRWKFPAIQYAGWHLSSFGDAKHVWNKIQTYAHAHDDKHKNMSLEDFKDWVSNGVHSDGKTVLIPRPHEVPLPAPVSVLQRLGLGTFL
jgi:beta-1,4-mannosyl-glycoprotein beta-1,4-N-acetylglucosaminyltransferase